MTKTLAALIATSILSVVLFGITIVEHNEIGLLKKQCTSSATNELHGIKSIIDSSQPSKDDKGEPNF